MNTHSISETENLDSIYKFYSEEVGFENILLRYKVQSIKPHLKGKALLDVGCGVGFLCRAFSKYFDCVTGIDGSPKKIQKAKEINALPNINYIQNLFEDFNPEDKFDTIIVTNVLEHIETVDDFLGKVKSMLASEGRIIITVPNAKGLHKRIGKHLGMITDFYELTEADIEKGHQRIYDRDKLVADLESASFCVSSVEGILLKPLSHRQMESWDIEICDALYEIGKDLPDYCSSIMAICEKKL
ncbi:class I SAM-dependent methyltransferase [Methanolobus sp. ZRKC2]|uniref:class I SAM-dependent methyltransferase n=1 Tax=Methanolobus sp. ZRKC2 TaxID=3125783 RepID=UPI0032542874